MITFRPCETTDHDYAALTAIDNAAWPLDPVTVESWHARDARWNPEHFQHREVCEKDGAIVAYGMVRHTPWSFRPNKYQIHWDCLPAVADTIDPLMYAHMYSLIEARQPAMITASTREDKPKRRALYQANGFEPVMRYPVSHLAIADFDFTAYEGLPAHMEKQGVTILTLAELQARDAEWATKLEALIWHCDQDIPAPEPLTRQSMAQFMKMFDGPSFRADAWFIAVTPNADGPIGDYVAVTLFWCEPANQSKVYTGLTGTHREWRRKGVATALKVHAIGYAQQQGYNVIETDNEENNPMYDLNMQLGFQPQPAWLDFKKEITVYKNEQVKNEY